MPIDEFKTQVLLLHSEQTTLDTLSSGFSDRYTVHCATSGSEALNTLVETPINVLISAQELPGMSGLDALREAKKRSPDTIGILLAGNDEAIVGSEEVFQVVHGNVTSDGLLQLVDNATRQIRLMALAQSANDHAANPDEPVTEHIIMETADNGSTIISDGTGRLPILDPKKVSPAATVGSQAVDVLVLTKDQDFLETIKESSRGMHEVHYATTLSEADKAIRSHKVGVAVVDAAMVGEKVEQLTQHLRKSSPRLVSIVAGRRDDGDMLMDLINRGKVYRFLLKPVSPGRARLAVEASVKHHLEAPDSAFKISGGAAKAAANPAPKPAPKAAPRAAPKPAPKPAARPAPQAKAPPPQKKPAPAPQAAPQSKADTPVDPPLGSTEAPQGGSPIEDGLANAFGADDTSFTETVTGLISSVGGKRKKDPAPEPQASPALEMSPPTGSGGGSLNVKLIGIGAAVIVVAAAGLFWFFSGSSDSTPAQPVETPSQAQDTTRGVFDEAPLGPSSSDADALLDEARLARDAGQVFNPAGGNAIELFLAAQAADPQNAGITAELDAVISEALTMAETAMLESRLDDAAAALDRVALADATNQRLPFLGAQLGQMQLRGRLDEARVAVREGRFEDAGTALTAARNLGVEDSGEIAAVSAELQAARSEQQVDEVLERASARLDSGNLLEPANDNARFYYELALSNDPGNAAAEAGLNTIVTTLVLQAREALDGDDLDVAADRVADARSIDPNNVDMLNVANAISNRRDAIAAAQRADAERREAARLRAEREAAAQREQERVAAEQQAQEDAAAAEEPVITDDASEAEPAAADESKGEQVAEATTTPEPVENASIPVSEQTPAAVSTLNRTRYVAPKYPRSAQRRNLSGWVDVVFTVTFDGTVKDIDVRNSEPGETFVNSAIKAVEKWEFEPVIEDGSLVEKRVGVRMMFALE